MSKRLALLFPGQGSQIVGMGKDLVRDFPYISNLYNQSDKILDYPLSNLMFNGPAEELIKTENTQPALLLHSFSMIKILEKELGFKDNNIDQTNEYKVSNEFIKRFDFMLGHSLGEYTALATVNSIDFKSSLELVRYRGKLMSESKPPGVMYALLNKSNMIENGQLDEIKQIINQTIQQDTSLICNISNVNSPNQIVISGNEIGVSKVLELCKLKKLYSRSIKLQVGTAFHSDLMKSCSDKFKLKLDTIDIKLPSSASSTLPKIISNVNALPYDFNIDSASNNSIQSLLSKQLSSTVQWTSSIKYCVDHWQKSQNLKEDDYCFIEIGSNNVLVQLLKQQYPNSISKSIQSSSDLINLIKEFK